MVDDPAWSGGWPMSTSLARKLGDMCDIMLVLLTAISSKMSSRRLRHQAIDNHSLDVTHNHNIWKVCKRCQRCNCGAARCFSSSPIFSDCCQLRALRHTQAVFQAEQRTITLRCQNRVPLCYCRRGSGGSGGGWPSSCLYSCGSCQLVEPTTGCDGNSSTS
jgi:hypothetical protein